MIILIGVFFAAMIGAIFGLFAGAVFGSTIGWVFFCAGFGCSLDVLFRGTE